MIAAGMWFSPYLPVSAWSLLTKEPRETTVIMLLEHLTLEKR